MVAGHQDLLLQNSPHLHYWTFSLKTTNPVGKRPRINTPQYFYSGLLFKPSWKLSPVQPLAFPHPLSDTDKGQNLWVNNLLNTNTSINNTTNNNIHINESDHIQYAHWVWTDVTGAQLTPLHHSINQLLHRKRHKMSPDPRCSTFLFHLKSRLLLRKEIPLPLPIPHLIGYIPGVEKQPRHATQIQAPTPLVCSEKLILSLA